MTLRKALAYLDASIAVGLLVENWSAYPLSKPTIEINEGKVVQENTTIPVPGSVKAGTMNAGIVLQSKVQLECPLATETFFQKLLCGNGAFSNRVHGLFSMIH